MPEKKKLMLCFTDNIAVSLFEFSEQIEKPFRIVQNVTFPITTYKEYKEVK
jgi:hypothetical protein